MAHACELHATWSQHSISTKDTRPNMEWRRYYVQSTINIMCVGIFSTNSARWIPCTMSEYGYRTVMETRAWLCLACIYLIPHTYLPRYSNFHVDNFRLFSFQSFFCFRFPFSMWKRELALQTTLRTVIFGEKEFNGIAINMRSGAIKVEILLFCDGFFHFGSLRHG